ncbi:hypothetical protein BW70_23005 [Escherichia coli O174:H8 str. 04-3038]|nr:hypothetical protein BW70_23005 [Escherichia coli O174:H8 str. 04-3038]
MSGHSLTTAYPTIRSYRRVARQCVLQSFQLNVFLNPVSVARLKPLHSLLRISVKGTSATVIKLHFVEVSNLFKLRLWQLVSPACRYGTIEHGSAAGIPACSVCSRFAAAFNWRILPIHFFRHYRRWRDSVKLVRSIRQRVTYILTEPVNTHAPIFNNA